MFAVIPARNEEARIERAIRTVRLAGARQLILVLNGCTDDTARIAREMQQGDLTLLRFREPLGVDVPRAAGAAYALKKGAEHVLFYDGDLIGHHLDELRKLLSSAMRHRVDLALTDTYGSQSHGVPSGNLLLRLRRDLSLALGLERRIGLSNPAHGPHVVSSRLLRQLPLPCLAKPPLVLAHAVRSGLHVDALAHIPHARLGSAHKGPAHAERIRETIIGDLLEALHAAEGRPPQREYRGLHYDGYDSERRFDLLDAFARSMQQDDPIS